MGGATGSPPCSPAVAPSGSWEVSLVLRLLFSALEDSLPEAGCQPGVRTQALLLTFAVLLKKGICSLPFLIGNPDLSESDPWSSV